MREKRKEEIRRGRDGTNEGEVVREEGDGEEGEEGREKRRRVSRLGRRIPRLQFSCN